MLHPLPEGTTIFINVTADYGDFQAKGRIVYAVPGLGAGVAFLAPTPELVAQLQHSLADGRV